MKIPKTGEQTKITQKVREVADGIEGESIKAVINIADYIKSMGEAKGPEPDFTRTAEEILKDDKYNGCNEAGVVFAALLRAKGIPTTYIQALNRDAVMNYTPNKPSLKGHVFLEINIGYLEENTNIKMINSTTGEITDSLPDNMMVGRKGFDAWDVGLKEGFVDLQKVFEEKHSCYQ
jgi:hypothetical protein